MKAAATMEPAATVKPLSSVEVIAAVKVTAARAAIESTSIPAAAVVAIAATVITATIVAAPVAVSMIAVVAAIPRAGADEDAAHEPVRSVIAVGGAGVRIIVVIAIGADGSGPVIHGTSYTDAKGDALGVSAGSREETNTETNAE
jgi:hypothetical protein